MEFIDKTGHIFSLDSYQQEPIGYKYEEHPYIFWVNETGKLSIKNYYIIPIRFILSNDDYQDLSDYKLKISIESNQFFLLGSNVIQDKLQNNENIFDYIDLDKNNITSVKTLTEEDILAITNLKNDNIDSYYTLITFYVGVTSDEEATWLTNILIEVIDDNTNKTLEYCPITVGAEFIDESEALIINGKNMGINLPKDILRALYSSSYFNEKPDEYLYNNKLKELLLNYMLIKGECGNYKSVINSLKWFGWGDNITISKLLQTDNEFINQYILDYFDITNDTLKSFNNFKNSTYIKLQLAGTKEGEEMLQDFSKDFFGEGKPKIIDLINSMVPVKYDEEDIIYYRPYYNFLFTELGLKLSYLDKCFKKYFLPIHISIHSTSIANQCFMNDLKMEIGVNKQIISEVPQLLEDSTVFVEFPNNSFEYFYTHSTFIDDNYNVFNKYIISPEKEVDDLFWVDETCLQIPIKFNQYNIYSDGSKEEKEEQYYDCELILEKNEASAFNYLYTFNQTFSYNDMFNIMFINNDDTAAIKDDIHISYNIIYPDEIFSGKNEYITITDENYYALENCRTRIKKLYNNQSIKNNRQEYVSHLLWQFQIKVKSKKYLKSIKLNNNNIIKETNCEIIDDTHNILFNKHFNFIQKTNDSSTLYNSLVIIPKIINENYDINFWLNSNLSIYLNVNGKWFTYNFNCKMPELYIELGKLQYKYYLDIDDLILSNNGSQTLFNQIRGFNNDTIKFNHFIWQPELVEVNNINFFDDLTRYYANNKYNIIYDNNTQHINYGIIEGSEENNYDIMLNDLYYVFYINNQIFYIHKDVITNYIIENKNEYINIPLKYLSEENRNNNYIYFYTDESLVINAVYNEDGLSDVAAIKGSSGSGYPNQDNQILITNELGKNILFNTINANDYDVDIMDYEDKDNYIIVFEDEHPQYTHIKVFVELQNNIIKFYIKDSLTNKIYLKTYKSLYKNYEVLLDKYKDIPNIVNNQKYSNRIHYFTLFDENKNSIYFAEDNDSRLVSDKYHFIYNDHHYYTSYGIFSILFNEDGTSKINIPYLDQDYDFYLMHGPNPNSTEEDKENIWYVMFISKLTNNKLLPKQKELSDEQQHLIYNHNETFLEINNNNYREINKEIIKNVLLNSHLIEGDLYIVMNNIADNNYNENEEAISGSIEELTKIGVFDKYLINAIFNKNIGGMVYDVDLSFNRSAHWEEDNDHPTTVGHIAPEWVVDKYDEEGNKIEFDPNEVGLPIFWNKTPFGYKLLYTIEDDIYSEDNPTGKYHLPISEQQKSFKYILNNVSHDVLEDITDPAEKEKVYNKILNQLDSNDYKKVQDNLIQVIKENNLEHIKEELPNDIEQFPDEYKDANGNFISDIDEQIIIYIKLHHVISDISQNNINKIYHYKLPKLTVYGEIDNHINNDVPESYYLLSRYGSGEEYLGNWIVERYNEKYEEYKKLYTDPSTTLFSFLKFTDADNKELYAVKNHNYNYQQGLYNYNFEDTYSYGFNGEYKGNVAPEIGIKLYNPADGINWTLDFIYDYDTEDNEDTLLLYITKNSLYNYIQKYVNPATSKVDFSNILENVTNAYIVFCSFIDSNDGLTKKNMFVFNKNIFEQVTLDILNKKTYMDISGQLISFIWSDIQNKHVVRPILRTLSSMSKNLLYDINTKAFYNLGEIIDIDNETHKYAKIESEKVYVDNDGVDHVTYKYNVYIGEEHIENESYHLIFLGDKIIKSSMKWYYILNGKKYYYYGKINGSDKQTFNDAIIGIKLDLEALGEELYIPVQKVDYIAKKPAYYDKTLQLLFDYQHSDDKFLINRMQYVPSEGVNHFNSDDIIVSTLTNNDTLEFRLDYLIKWQFTPVSLKSDLNNIVGSTTQLGIMSLGNDNIKYNKGYYNISCKYSLDKNIQNVFTKKTRILIS